jgi:hypothetical protein
MQARHNDEERRLWVLNDEGLYSYWPSERPRIGLKRWIKENRSMIDECIDMVISGDKPAHYLRYGS